MVTQRLVTPKDPAQQSAGSGLHALDTTVVIPEMGGSIDSVRGEINDAFADMKTFYSREPDEIMRMAGGHSARLSELRVMCMRTEDWYRPARDLRTRELEPCLEELERQWRNASRLHSVRELDWRMEAGER